MPSRSADKRPRGTIRKAYCEIGDMTADALVPLLVALAPPATPGKQHWVRPRLVGRPAG